MRCRFATAKGPTELFVLDLYESFLSPPDTLGANGLNKRVFRSIARTLAAGGATLRRTSVDGRNAFNRFRKLLMHKNIIHNGSYLEWRSLNKSGEVQGGCSAHNLERRADGKVNAVAVERGLWILSAST